MRFQLVLWSLIGVGCIAHTQEILRPNNAFPELGLYRLPDSGDEILPSLEAYDRAIIERVSNLYSGPRDALPEGVRIRENRLTVKGRLRPDLIPIYRALAIEMKKLVDGNMRFEAALEARGFDPGDFEKLIKGTGELSNATFYSRSLEKLEKRFWFRNRKLLEPSDETIREYQKQYQEMSREADLHWAGTLLGLLSNSSKRALISYLVEKTVHSMDVGFNIGPYPEASLNRYRQYISRKHREDWRRK